MWKNNLLLRVAGPTILVSLLLLGFCIAAAVYLYNQQAASSEDLSESVESRRVARDIEVNLVRLIQLVGSGSEQADGVHQVIRELLARAQKLADQEDEKRLVGELTESFGAYYQHWQGRFSPD